MRVVETSYACPVCGRNTDLATVTPKGYEPKAGDHRLRPQMLGKGDQLLTCPCGQQYTWFSALEVTTRDLT